MSESELEINSSAVTQVVESEVRRESGLIMPFEKRFGFGHVGPCGEPFAPPTIVFGNRMILRKIKGYQSSPL
jgi:hypothetical protein